MISSSFTVQWCTNNAENCIYSEVDLPTLEDAITYANENYPDYSTGNWSYGVISDPNDLEVTWIDDNGKFVKPVGGFKYSPLQSTITFVY